MIAKVLLAIAALLSAAALSAEDEPSATDEGYSKVIAYVEAYNARDLQAMMALMHDDVQWLSIEGSSVAIFADGKQDLASQMEGYFASPSATRSEVLSYVVDGRFVSVREVASWTDKEGAEKSQSALAVYEFEDGLVRRVWYYPASR
ncbi:MAG: nuclear transport factor 2 family protein [Pseudomonadota bacterium]